MFAKLKIKINILLLKIKLKSYEKNSEWYNRYEHTPNWYDDFGIPNVQQEIYKLEQGCDI